jgi:hypothetical protein
VDGQYTVSSAYDYRFIGYMTTFTPGTVWKAKIEPKCRFFSWLVLHDRVLTTDNMAKKNWPYNPVCSLCSCIQEITSHLLSQCNFTEASWNIVATASWNIMASALSLPQYSVLANKGGPGEWMGFLQVGEVNMKERRMLGLSLPFGGKFGKNIIEESLTGRSSLISE